MSLDYYKVLGIHRGADEQAIRQAYKKLALRYHPDRAGGDEERFKQVSEAYAALSNNKNDAMASAPAVEVTEIFKAMFDYLFPRRSPDRTIPLPVSLEEVMTGIIIPYRLQRRIHQQIVWEVVYITVPLGTPDKTVFTMDNKGDDVEGCDIRGDVHFVITYKPHPVFTVSGMDLVWETTINLLEFCTGFERVVEMPDGTVVGIRLESGDVLTSFEKYIPGRGLAYKGHSGDLVVRIVPRFPSVLPVATRRGLERLLGRIETKERVDRHDECTVLYSLS
jgi:DnaJ-class molecular chaperone